MSSPASLSGEVRRLLVPVYLPWGMVTLGAGVLLPIFPVYLEEQGLRLSLVGLVTAAGGIGLALGGLPASSFAERRGTDKLLAIGVLLCAITTALLGISSAVIVLVVLRVAWGAGFTSITQSRQVVVARTVAVGMRGRVNSLVGGMHRLTFVVGPILGGFTYDRFGANPTFALAGGLTVLGTLPLVSPGGRDPHPVAERADRISVRDSLWRHRRLLLVASFGPLLVSSARDGRNIVVPLIGDDLQLDATAIGLLVAVGTAADFLLFPLSGWLMDRRGRLACMVPAFSLMAGGLIVLSMADTVAVAVVAGIVMGIGNGLSSGTMLTLSTDMAPPDEPGPFIAGFHTLSGIGHIVGPLIVGWVADTIGLSASAFVLALVLLAGVLWIALVIGETSRQDDRRTVAR